jgi:hypothetical protein
MANEYLRRVNTSGGNRRVFTWAAWVKRSNVTPLATTALFSGANPVFNTSGQQEFILYIGTGDDFFINFGSSGVVQDGLITTTQKFRDCGNWFHLIVAVDSTKVNSTDRIRIYLNGSLITDFSSISYPSRNYEFSLNRSGFTINVGGKGATGNEWLGELTDVFSIDGQALTPDVFGFYKQGKGYISVGSTQSTDFRPGQWVPKTPRVIKTEINRRGGFGVNGFYLPMNDSKNFGADFHCDPNSIITLNEKLPQPRVGVASTAVGIGYTDALRADPYAANLVLALPFVSGGLSSGFGDYAPSIKGSGSVKVATLNGNVAIANTAGYYGSGAYFDGSGDYLSFSDSGDWHFSSGNFTAECWVYPIASPSQPIIMGQWDGAGGGTGLSWVMILSNDSNRYLRGLISSTGSGVDFDLVSSTSLGLNQWNHCAFVKNGSTFTLYLNGVSVALTTDSDALFNATNSLTIGASSAGSQPFNGYLQDLRIYKGVAKYTGGFDVPRPYTPVGIATWRAVPDTTANNFATLNAVQINRPTLTAGNLNWSASTAYVYGQGTIGIPPTGKWVFEGRFSNNTSTDNYNSIGVGINTTPPASPFNSSGNYGINDASATFGQSFVQNGVRQGSITLPAGTIIQVLIDRDNNTMTFVKDGTLQTGTGSTVTIPSSVTLYPMIGEYNLSGQINFGQNPSFSGNTTAGTFTDSNSKGLFKYQPPSGFLSLCEDNLPTPAISDPGKYFKTVLWTGDGNNGRSIVGVGFTPDLVWTKYRNVVNNHHIFDSLRGPFLSLKSNTTGADQLLNTTFLSINSDGFSLGSSGDVNASGGTYVAWCWKAGAGTTSTNTNGSITSVVSVNQDAGFSVVSWTGNGSSTATVGHGLGKVPAFLISKARGGTNDWWVVHKSGNGNLQLNTTSALITSGGTNGSMGYPSTLTNSTFTFTNGSSSVNNVNQSGVTYISYCWAEIEGFSKAFSYVGNGNADGPLVYLNFKPAFVIIKQTNGTGDWYIFDSSRNSTNPVTLGLLSNTAQIDGDYTGWGDFLSNGFKIRRTDSAWNGSGSTYVGFAWAESPFQTANAK